MTTSAVYRHPPIAVVLLEVRHPVSELPAPALPLIKETLRDYTPIERVERTMGFEIAPNGQPIGAKESILPKFVSRDVHTAVTYRPDGVAIETTDYLGWEWFKQVAERALFARQEFAPVDGIERIGLRYVDEVRVPHSNGVLDWSDWVISDLLGPRKQVESLGLRLQEQQSVFQFQMPSPGMTFTLRCGIGTGAVVQSSDNLRRPQEPPRDGQFFLIDSDAAWVEPEGKIPEFDPSHILNVSEELHSPIKKMFEELITDKLREEVFNGSD